MVNTQDKGQYPGHDIQPPIRFGKDAIRIWCLVSFIMLQMIPAILPAQAFERVPFQYHRNGISYTGDIRHYNNRVIIRSSLQITPPDGRERNLSGDPVTAKTVESFILPEGIDSDTFNKLMIAKQHVVIADALFQAGTRYCAVHSHARDRYLRLAADQFRRVSNRFAELGMEDACREVQRMLACIDRIQVTTDTEDARAYFRNYYLILSELVRYSICSNPGHEDNYMCIDLNKRQSHEPEE